MPESHVYDGAIQALFNGEIDVGTDTIRMTMLTGGYVYDPTDDFLFDIHTQYWLGSGNLSGVSVVGRTFFADDKVVPNVLVGPVEAFVLYKWTGNSLTSRLIYFSNDSPDFPFPANGSDLTFDFDNVDGIFSL